MITVRLAFHNLTAKSSDVIFVERPACEPIARWYGAFHAGDAYDVFIDGEHISIDVDGALSSDPHYRS